MSSPVFSFGVNYIYPAGNGIIDCARKAMQEGKLQLYHHSDHLSRSHGL